MSSGISDMLLFLRLRLVKKSRLKTSSGIFSSPFPDKFRKEDLFFFAFFIVSRMSFIIGHNGFVYEKCGFACEDFPKENHSSKHALSFWLSTKISIFYTQCCT